MGEDELELKQGSLKYNFYGVDWQKINSSFISFSEASDRMIYAMRQSGKSICLANILLNQFYRYQKTKDMHMSIIRKHRIKRRCNRMFNSK